MHLSHAADHARRNTHLLVPLLFVLAAATKNVHTPVRHELLVAAVSWAVVCVCTLIWTGFGTLDEKRRTGWTAGVFLAMGVVCGRAAGDREGVWATKGLLPLLVVALCENSDFARQLRLPIYTPPTDEISTGAEQRVSFRILCMLTLSASFALSTPFIAPPVFALGISSVVFSAVGLVLFDSALKPSLHDARFDKSPQIAANGTPARPRSSGGVAQGAQLGALRDVAVVMAAVCGVATWFMEPRIMATAVEWEVGGGTVKGVRHWGVVRQVVGMVVVDVGVIGLGLLILSRQGAVHTSLLSLFTYICARLQLGASWSGVWFTIIYAFTALTFLSGTSTSTSAIDIRSSLRLRRGLYGIMALSVGFVLFRDTLKERHGLPEGSLTPLHTSPPATPFGPVQIDMEKGHPAAQLIENAEKEFRDMLDRQSKSLAEAVAEYRRRNGIAPPPHFDKWYEFATRNGVVLIDEFDTISQALLPYWGLKPSTIRSRIRNALGNEDNALIGITIRDGKVVKAEGEPEWQREATIGMMDKFVQYLPDMDLGFNIHDEPRVAVPNDHLSAMVVKAQEVLSEVAKKDSLRNSFSPRPSDVNNGQRIEEVSYSRFNRFAHQQTWTNSRLSCPANSQAQQFEDQVSDNLTAYAASPLNYILNHTAFTDICNSPSFSGTYGFFERPNAFSILHELTPIFSSSKISSFQDILFPSPWYWADKVAYEEKHDTTWENKTNALYWRGSTTGGFSRKGGWRRQHRQRVVRRLNALDKANISVLIPDSQTNAHEINEVDRPLYRSLIDVHFSHIGQCDPGDCDAQREFFQVTEHADGQNAWYFKHLLDMDGNAFSGRFYAFLSSRSLTYKMAVFREWHAEWLRPWVHYIPLSLIGDEYLDLVRWFSGTEVRRDGQDEKERGPDKGGNGATEGERKAREVAQRSREWAGRALRKVDFEAWFFRVLLEYGRVVDEAREGVGFAGP